MSSSPNSSAGIQGQQHSADGASQFNAHVFLVRQMLNRIATATLVKVVAVTNDGGVSPVGFVDIQPLVNQVDGDGNAVPFGTIHSCPYMRLQGGANAVILDPKVGDIGIAVFASRDLSSVIATKAQANPGSGRTYAWADGLYVGGVLNGTPSQYVQFSDDGITLLSPTKVKAVAPTTDIESVASVTATTPACSVSGNLTVGTGATGTFTTPSGNIVTVQDGIVTNIF